jgi:hypothetical protein
MEPASFGDLVDRRLRNQQLATGGQGRSPEAVVATLGAVQAQDYLGAKWAVAQRAGDCTDSEVEEALDRGAILRTHVLRPTWHFVPPADIRWLLALTAPRVHALNAPYYRQTQLDARLLARSDAALAKAVQGGRYLTRDEARAVLLDAGIHAAGLRLALLLMHAELEAVVCSGPRRGKQFTYAALDERAPAARDLPADEALAELARRYFTGHGPARAQDFAWWSGLRVADAQQAIQALGPALERVDRAGSPGGVRPLRGLRHGRPTLPTPPGRRPRRGRVWEPSEGSHLDSRAGKDTYWVVARGTGPRRRRGGPLVHLLPSYDEYVVAYRNHAPIVEAGHAKTLSIRGGFVGAAVILVDGRVAGSWRRTPERAGVTIHAALLLPLDTAAHAALGQEAERYGRFLGLPIRLDVRGPGRAPAKTR